MMTEGDEKKMALDLAMLSRDVVALTVTMNHVQAKIESMQPRQTPWHVMVGAIILVVTPAAGVWNSTSRQLEDLRIADENSRNERREMVRNITRLESLRCPAAAEKPL